MPDWEQIAKDQARTIARAYWELEAFLNGRNPSQTTLRGVVLGELRQAKHRAAILELYGPASRDYLEADLIQKP